MKDPEPFKIGLSQNSMRFLNKIAYDMQYDGFANVSDEGERLAKVLGDKDLLLMGQHGVLAVAKRACDAFDNLYYLERAAQIQVCKNMITRRNIHEYILLILNAFKIEFDFCWVNPRHK